MQKHFVDFHLIFKIHRRKWIFRYKCTLMPLCGQIWQRKGENRSVSEKLIPKGFQFVKKSENPDIRRVGVYAGNVYTDISTKSEQSHYFIKFDKKISESTEQLNAVVFSRDNTAETKVHSKQELMKHYNTFNFEQFTFICFLPAYIIFLFPPVSFLRVIVPMQI